MCVNPHMADTTAARTRALRKRLGLTQDDVAARAARGDPEFRRDYVTKVETGANKATSLRIQQGLARGLGLTTDDLAAYLAGRITTEEAAQRAVQLPRGDLQIERDHEERVPEDDETPLETALFRVMNPDQHTARDFDAARAAIRGTGRKLHPHADIEATAKRLLDAAYQLRIEGEQVTTNNILWRAAVGKTERAAEVVREVSDAHAAEVDASLRAAGHEPGQGSANLKARLGALKDRRDRRGH